MSQFTPQELDLVFDGLDALASKASQHVLMKNMFGAMMPPTPEDNALSTEELHKKMDTKLKNELDEIHKEQKIMGERIILLKAKLIQLRDSANAEDLLNEIENLKDGASGSK